ncbi:MAG: hypothetical protein ABFC80_04165 [Coriobacteriales bacterium]|nr:hypothetical protein [Actinomycetes bacterium]
MSRTARRAATAWLMIASCLVLAGCSASFEYVPEGESYTLSEVEELAQETPLGSASKVDVSRAADVRQERLAELRGHGEAAKALADALTRDFPADHPAVPVYIEAGTVDGTDAWIIVEAWGEDEGPLTHRRVWVLDRTTYAVLGSASFR